MPASQIALMVTAAVLAVSACTATPKSATEPTPSPSSAVENVSGEPSRFTVFRASDNDGMTPLPRRMHIGDRAVETRLSCVGTARRTIIPGMSPMTLKELALLSTSGERKEATAVIVLKSRRHGVLLGLNQADELISQWQLSRLGAHWGVDSASWCIREG